MRDHDALVDKTNLRREETERGGDTWGQDNDSTEPGYVWGYTLGVLLILLGLAFSLFDWSWIKQAEKPDATLIDMSPLFWFGIAVFVSPMPFDRQERYRVVSPIRLSGSSRVDVL